MNGEGDKYNFPIHHLARDAEGDTGKDDCHNDTDEHQW